MARGGVVCVQLPISGVQRLKTVGGYQPGTPACSATHVTGPSTPSRMGPRPGPHLVLGVELSFVAMWWLGGHVRMDGADGCRLRERMSGQDGAAGVAAAPGQFLTRALAPAASLCGEAGPPTPYCVSRGSRHLRSFACGHLNLNPFNYWAPNLGYVFTGRVPT